jgi:hypothetical protein
MGMRRKHKDRERLPSEIDVGDIPPLPGKEPAVFLAANRLSDAEAHAALSFICVCVPGAYYRTVAASNRTTYDDLGGTPMAAVRIG